MKRNFLKLLNTPIEDVIAAIVQLRNYCKQENVGKPFLELEFIDIFYFTYVHKNKDKIPPGMISYVKEYAIKYEEGILEELCQENGFFDWLIERPIGGEFYAKEFLTMSVFYRFLVTKELCLWAQLETDLLEIYPELEDTVVVESFDARCLKRKKI